MGSIVSINDAIPFTPIDSIIAEINPVQDLHGYDYPWPAEGNINKLNPTANICPISGHTGCSVVRTGKNLANLFIDGLVPSISNGELVSASGARSDFIRVMANTSYNISLSGNYTTASIFYYDQNKKFIRYSSLKNQTTITPTTAVWVMFRVNGVTSVDNITFQFETGTETALEPYNGTTVDVSWESEVGTVYGGTLDVITGSLTVNKKMVTYTGIENWKAITGKQQRYYINKPNDCVTSTSRTGYTLSHFGDLWSSGNNGTWGTLVVGGTTFKVLDSGAHFADLAAFKTWLADQNNNGTPLQIVYPLNSNIVYQLTPQQVDTLLGINNIWADTGDVTVTYSAGKSFRRYSFASPLGNYNPSSLKLFNDTFIEHGKG